VAVATAQPVDARPRLGRGRLLVPLAQLTPTLLYFLAFYVGPLIVLAYFSFLTFRNFQFVPPLTFNNYVDVANSEPFRILFARLGQPYCPECDIPIGTQTSDQIVDKLLEEPTGTKLYIMAPVEVAVGEQYESLWDSLRGGGYIRVRIDGETHSLSR